MTGKDFGEDASRHSHNVAILDTKTLNLTFIENPHAFNFYKIQIDSETDLNLLKNLKANSIVSIKCDSMMVDRTKEQIAVLDNIIESRLIVVKKYEENSETDIDIDLTVDHLARFIECCKANIEDTALLDEEISEVCK